MTICALPEIDAGHKVISSELLFPSVIKCMKIVIAPIFIKSTACGVF